MAHVFGPVPSRRLGRSLGIDLVPFKTCSYDCIYCQLGRTTNKTVERREWVELGTILDELREKLSSRPDYVTLSGSGEPVLYSRVGELIEGMHSMTRVPVAVLTNGSLLWQEDVQEQLLSADLVIPSLDAGDPETFEAVNRPHSAISFEKMVDGLAAFRSRYGGAYWLEVFLLGGVTDAAAAVEKIAGCVRRISPDKVQLNTVTRPPAEKHARPVGRERLEEICRLFRPRAEVIADFRHVHAAQDFEATRQTVMEMLQRRPCSIEDVAGGLGIHRNEAVKHVEELLRQDSIEQVDVDGKAYFRSRGDRRGSATPG